VHGVRGVKAETSMTLRPKGPVRMHARPL
jgi:hypothetical protein